MVRHGLAYRAGSHSRSQSEERDLQGVQRGESLPCHSDWANALSRLLDCCPHLPSTLGEMWQAAGWLGHTWVIATRASWIRIAVATVDSLRALLRFLGILRSWEASDSLNKSPTLYGQTPLWCERDPQILSAPQVCTNPSNIPDEDKNLCGKCHSVPSWCDAFRAYASIRA